MRGQNRNVRIIYDPAADAVYIYLTTSPANGWHAAASASPPLRPKASRRSSCSAGRRPPRRHRDPRRQHPPPHRPPRSSRNPPLTAAPLDGDPLTAAPLDGEEPISHHDPGRRWSRLCCRSCSIVGAWDPPFGAVAACWESSSWARRSGGSGTPLALVSGQSRQGSARQRGRRVGSSRSSAGTRPSAPRRRRAQPRAAARAGVVMRSRMRYRG